MKKIRLILLALIVGGCSTAQQPVAIPVDRTIQVQNERASFPGGKEALQRFVNDNFDNAQLQLSTSGKVYVEFTVSETGEVSGAAVQHLPNVIGVGDQKVEAECVRVANAMPNWNPQVMKGKTMAAPVSFAFLFEKGEITLDL